jgi:xanthine dehydrogenase accessory factor
VPHDHREAVIVGLVSSGNRWLGARGYPLYMSDRRQIAELWRTTTPTALVTLVHAEGSSYRRPGARLLITPTAYAGTISGGCLEAEVIRKAAWMVRDGALVERYSTLFDDTAQVPYGLGCGGIVDLLIEPANTPEAQALRHAIESSLRGLPSTVVTWLPNPAADKPLRRVILDPTGAPIFSSPNLEPKKLACASTLDPSREYEGRFVEQLLPPQRLVVLGAGDDAKPLVRMAALLGWRTIIADGRTQLARPERFPEAEQVTHLTNSSITPLNIAPDDAVVIMTHSYEQDRDLLAAVLPIAPRYLGLLGARHRSSLLLTEAAAITGLTVAECCARLYAPVGLDLGGDGPEAIALAVIAEAQASIQGKLGASRRLSPEDVARHVAEGPASRYLQAHCALDLSDHPA